MKSALLADVAGHVGSGNVAGACMASAKLFATCKLAATQEAAISLATDPKYAANATFAAFMAGRLQMTDHPRYRKDVVALRRVLCEVFAVLARNAGGAPGSSSGSQPTVTPCTVKTIHKGRCAELLGKFCTKDVLAVVTKLIRGSEDVSACVDELLAVKGYDIEVPVPLVARAHCNDPAWLVWRIVTEAYVCDPTLAGYVENLFFMYRYKYKASCRKTRACLLKLALAAIANRSVASWDVSSAVCVEAVWKIQYVYLELEDGGAGGGGQRQKASDVISTMLL